MTKENIMKEFHDRLLDPKYEGKTAGEVLDMLPQIKLSPDWYGDFIREYFKEVSK